MKHTGKPFKQKTILFIALISIAILTTFILSGCGGSGSGEKGTVITQAGGGTYTMDGLEVDFPPGSVNEDIEVTGSIAVLDNIPYNIELLSDVYDIDLIYADAYMENTATVKITLDQLPDDLEDLVIFHSEEGWYWDELETTIEGNVLSATAPSFSYFAAGKKTSSGVRYDFSIYNNSSSTHSMYLYQENSTYPSEITPVAWKVTTIPTRGASGYNWMMDYSFTYGVVNQRFQEFKPYKTIPADLSKTNMITLFFQQSPHWLPNFKDQRPGPEEGSLYVFQDKSIYGNYYAGVGMDGCPTFITPAKQNQTTVFDTKNTRLWLAATRDYMARGKVINPSQVKNKVEIVFPEGVTRMTAKWNADLTWTLITE